MGRRFGGALLVVMVGLMGCTASQPRPAVSGGASVRGTSQRYVIAAPPGWRQVDARRDSDLTLNGARGTEWLVVWYYPESDADLDSMVGSRRAALIKRGATGYEERRFFLPEADLVPASLARYAMPDETIVHVLTVVSERGAVEAVGGAAMGQDQGLSAALDSLRLTE